MPDANPVIEVAHVPQEVGVVGGDARRDGRSVICVRAVLDDVDDRQAQARGQGQLATADRAPVDVAHLDDHHPGRAQLVGRDEDIMRERHRHASEGAARRHSPEDVVAASGDGVGDGARLPVNGLQHLGASRRRRRKRAAVRAQDRGDVVVAHQVIDSGGRGLRGGGVDDVEAH